jgi:hypothetical protein
MAKGFASTTDLAEKKITFSEIGTDLYAFTAEGDPNSAIIVGDDGCLVFDAQSTPAMANIDPALQPIAIAGVAGLLFMVPDMIIGTPIPQVRTMQMLALCLALPYLAYGVTRQPQKSPVPGYGYVQPTVPMGARAA